MAGPLLHTLAAAAEEEEVGCGDTRGAACQNGQQVTKSCKVSH